MEWIHIVGYAGAFFTGIILGFLGGGGAVLSIPVLVYIFHVDARTATGYSLFLVGITALSGAFQNLRKNLVDLKAVAVYGPPSMLTVYAVRRFFIPELPDIILQVNGLTITRNQFILIMLSVVMLVVGYKMIRAQKVEEEAAGQVPNYFRLALYAVPVGGFLGVVGAGGGFLMIPALVHYGKLHMKKAIGTSLVLVAANCFVGFAGELHANENMNWNLLLSFAAFSIAGVFTGNYLGNFVNGPQLKKYFGWFMVLVAVYIVVREFL